MTVLQSFPGDDMHISQLCRTHREVDWLSASPAQFIDLKLILEGENPHSVVPALARKHHVRPFSNAGSWALPQLYESERGLAPAVLPVRTGLAPAVLPVRTGLAPAMCTLSSAPGDAPVCPEHPRESRKCGLHSVSFISRNCFSPSSLWCSPFNHIVLFLNRLSWTINLCHNILIS